MSISLDDLPKSLNAVSVHFAPITDEVSDEVAEKLKNYAQIVYIDPQVLFLNFNEKEIVTLK